MHAVQGATHPQEAQVSAGAALDEPTRRRLYDHVVRRPGPVSRDDAAAELGLARTTVASHLDRLVDEGLLDVVFGRRSGRTGPGAGRPAKLCRRSGCEVAVCCPSGTTPWPGSYSRPRCEENQPQRTYAIFSRLA